MFWCLSDEGKMKLISSAAVILAIVVSLAGELRADGREFNSRTQTSPGPVLVGGPGAIKAADRRNFHAVKPSRFHYYVPGNYYQPYYPQVIVISPYAATYVPAPTVVVTSPFFCVLHNEGWVSRIGLLDHLAGMHKIPLDAAANLCPDGTDCIFPSY
jgi:hypothetical protein